MVTVPWSQHPLGSLPMWCLAFAAWHPLAPPCQSPCLYSNTEPTHKLSSNIYTVFSLNTTSTDGGLWCKWEWSKMCGEETMTVILPYLVIISHSQLVLGGLKKIRPGILNFFPDTPLPKLKYTSSERSWNVDSCKELESVKRRYI